ncbi:MAG TPA: cyclic dehypoxanthinyl futalosine synthase [bacterium]|nr:dehypoxanthine futalosine cyclase [Candidatus Omnitrophota bacterium]HOJ60761.1 cyclic dehypoxanthinyl futalosine synthase [bacterium]HOL94852.1 cyclic dehypoxanthinyl futalosine synthase [bacterium]HPO99714.1 cyclic dehypoxanthinyl futalosine synthase [bacterium]HXK93894.1 cyclic dehypoxanthinyl futalosine synthase [bacterium]
MACPFPRMNLPEAVEWLRSDDLAGLGEKAHQARLAQADPRVVTYVVDRNINYSNVCAATCEFCAFYRKPGDAGGYVLPLDELFQKIEELVNAGGTQVLLQGGLHPHLPLDFYCDLLNQIKRRFPVDLHAFSAPEIFFFSKKFKMSIPDVLATLQQAGLDTIPGGGAEILSDRVRKAITKGKCLTRDWLAVHEEAHKLGMRTTATMMFGHIETLEERIGHLEHIRSLQDRTGGFTAFIPWTFQAPHTDMADVPESGAVDYLKTLAVSRLYLDNIPNLQASFITQGKQVGQMALFFGANDMGGTMMEENVVAATGVHNCSNENEVRKLVEDAGFVPRKRNTLYQFLN